MSEKFSQSSQAKDVLWDPGYAGELDPKIEKRVGFPLNPTSIAWLIGTGALLLFCQAFLRRLSERFGEDSANYVADRVRDLGNRSKELKLSQNPLSVRPGNTMRNLLSLVTRSGAGPVPHPGAASTERQAESDSFIYRVVVISISQLTGRRKP